MRQPRRTSVFLRLVLLMAATVVVLIVLVTAFFLMTPNRDLTVAVHRLLEDHAALVAASAPDLPAAIRLHERLGYDLRYEGPAGGWTTADDLPTIEEARRHAERQFSSPPHLIALRRDDYSLEAAPDGGWYLFSWRIGRRLQPVHDSLVALLALFVAGVLLAAYAVLRRLMRPLGLLSDGVARLSAGELDVSVPVRSRDEFGTLTEAFNQMVQRVREMVQARDQLLLDVSHELRSPLTRMKVALELLPEGKERERMAGDVAEMESMLAELLEIERLRDGRGLRLERQDLVAIARRIVAVAAERPPGVRLATGAPAVELDLDAEKIATVLRNLIDNALKYSLSDSGPIVVSIAEEAGAVVLRVLDDGPGIPETDLPALFEPFFRVDRSRSRKTGGYGLGLSLCKRIVEAHGGVISVENANGRGTRFEVRLPLSSRNPGSPAQVEGACARTV